MTRIKRRTLQLNFFDFFIVLLSGLLAVTALKKVETAEAKIEPKAEFVIDLMWPDMAKSDVDIWFLAPTGQKVYFLSKQNGLYSLDRDDLGESNDQVLQPDGSYKIVRVNREMLTMRGWVAGTYVINLHVYSWKDTAPIEATVRMLRLNPYKSVFERQVTLELKGQEITIASVTLDKDGNVTRIDYSPVELTR
jgi:hypothetical protein